MLKKAVLFAAVVLCGGFVQAQVLEAPLDGVYTKSEDTPNRKPVPYVQLFERDILWSTRVWREVDMREKINQVFYYPEKPMQGRVSLMTAFINGLTEKGNLRAYSVGALGDNDMFTIPLTTQEVEKILVEEVTVTKFDPFTGDPYDTTGYDTLFPYEITRFQIKEEVFFDKQRSVMEYRLLGIAPMKEIRNSSGEFMGYAPIFWIYYPQARGLAVNAEVYNRHNDMHRMTYDDLLWKRMFHGRVIKESNVYDRRLDQYLSPTDALLEGQRIEAMIFNFEHDVWSY